MKTNRKRKSPGTSNQPGHITKGAVFSDLGFSPSESAALKVKADLYFAIRRIIHSKGYKPRQLEKMLNQPQPRISELMNGKINQVSIEKLLGYLESLGEVVTLEVSTRPQAS